MKLRIAVVGFNYDLSGLAMRKIANADVSKIKKIQYNKIEMNDDTIYQIFGNQDGVRGYYIDQLIIVDDYRWMVYKQQEELIDWIKYRMTRSCVPEEFQIQEYEI